MERVHDADDLDRLVSVAQAARILGVSTDTLYRYDEKGILRPYRTAGGHRRYRVRDLVSFLNDSRENPPRAGGRGGGSRPYHQPRLFED